MPYKLTAEIGPARIIDVRSLQNTISGWKWSGLRKSILAARGARCEIYGTDKGQLQAHEVWKYLDAKHAGYDTASIRKQMSEVYKLDKRISAHFLKRRHRVIQSLETIQILCVQCHSCKHSHKLKNMSHWCRVNESSEEEFHAHYRSESEKYRNCLIIAADYGQFRNLTAVGEPPNGPEDDDDWIYAENEMNDGAGAFGPPPWIDRGP